MGQHLEQTHKSELNKVFVSLRQASCRDNGQLGTPCRLKVMELIELRAMGWRPNMAHSQYYINKVEETKEEKTERKKDSPPPAVPSHKPITNNYNTNFGPAFVPPFIPQQPMYDHQPVGPGYFLIPTNTPWGTGIMPANMISPFQQQMRPPNWLRSNTVAAAVGAHFKVDGFTKMIKQPQLREEITIKNADSGKIMGVKGRRVAVVEELSKTVISFQKVDHNSKYRILAISGCTSESIQHAKRLIEDTIRRNVSPNRMECNTITRSEPAPEEPHQAVDVEEPDVTIETGNDGSLKVSCADPEMLEAAQAALREYINLRTSRMSIKERDEKKDRRKSMPISSSATESDTKQIPEKKCAEEGMIPQSINTPLKAHGSTPNLMTVSIKPLEHRYDREAMFAIREKLELTDADELLVEKVTKLNVAAKRNDTLDIEN
ncbi:unnamed protein product [Bursaphelenchus okinawaensis]|uniref:K Homology domain-containing protein n=1 Tax=Bursaphelenchus okinawaensis TaxID=465554 RepID=A0A811JY51_9BILA|nr:unnamed protein product [Bursaphelenchus okinawaensis]CAG9086875.1 unnamed protein product [Bursaphelenchus okinawaensis]